MQITKNFSFYEFGPKGCNKNWVPDNDYQNMLITNLAKNLQRVRDIIGVPMTITSGVRTVADYNRLITQGLNPSETSDHFCGLAVPILPTSDKYKKFGKTYNFSVGAADVVPSGISVKDFFNKAMRCFLDNGANFGQIIHEYSAATKVSAAKEWVHFANDHELYFSKQIVTWLDKPRFLKSTDGGKTYVLVKG